jgi:hypothetical protein
LNENMGQAVVEPQANEDAGQAAQPPMNDDTHPGIGLDSFLVPVSEGRWLTLEATCTFQLNLSPKL